VAFNPTIPYALDELLSFNLGTGSNTSGDAQAVISTPAPASLMLAFTGMPVAAIGWLRRRRASA
jgi:hypothetical protein